MLAVQTKRKYNKASRRQQTRLRTLHIPKKKAMTAAFVGTSFFLLLLWQLSASTSPPNIIFILADDLGWNDVGWRNPQIYSPTLNKMAREGMILNQSYTQATCSPSRAALMSGRYPYHLGFQENTVSATQAMVLPDDQPIMPQALKSLGYATHMIGKWHLGFCNWRYTPTYRGFDSFYGFYNAAEDYFNHTQKGGYDFRDDDEVDKTAIGQYSTQLFTDRAVQVIQHHDSTHPLFLYLAYQAVHEPLEVLEHYMDDHCTHITDHDRRIKCGMVASLDEAVLNVTKTLENQGLMNNTFIIFSSDNGGPVHTASSNWPLRGSKITLWEGGTRAAAFVYSPLLQHTNTSYEELIHIVDWYPTFVEAAGGASAVAHIDGVSQWQNLISGGSGPRKEFLYNMNDVANNSALRQGRFKLVQGYPGSPNGWFASAEQSEHTEEIKRGHASSPDYQLFNLNRDPEERHNIIDTHQDVFQQMKTRLDQYRPSMVPTRTWPKLRESHPENFDGNWSPGWC